MTAEVEFAAGIDLTGASEGSGHPVTRRKVLPVYKPVYGSVVVPANATLPGIIEMDGSVPPGRAYNLLTLTLTSADGHTTLANAVADIFASSSGTILPDLSAQKYSAATVPCNLIWSRQVVWIMPGEKLFVLVYGFSDSSGPVPLQMVAWVDDWPFEEVKTTCV